MKKSLFFVLLVAFAMSVMAQDNTKRVLFIGNSYTEVNNLPSLVQLVSESAGQRISYSSNTPGGCTFSQHCTNNSMALIQQGGWDVVVLQEQSQLPSFPQSQVETECLPYAARLVDSIYANNPDGEAMFYMTWGRKYGDSRNAQYFPVLGTYEGMDSMLYERYMYMARTNDASVCPVGRVWRYLRTAARDIELYQGDESHPSMAGSYAAACAFYTMIFHRSPLEITYNPDLDDNQADVIRQAVKSVVYDTLSFWLRQQQDTIPADTTATDTTTTDTTHVGLAMVGALECQLSPNPAHGMVRISAQGGSMPCEGVIFDPRGVRVRSFRIQDGYAQLNISDLPVGVYTVTILSGKDKIARRLVVK